jgi:Rrf2 family cysteine metabolism transcriptional repressor
MIVTQKMQYALRAIFELAKRGTEEPVKTVEIAESQAIPPRFLEVIMARLARGGLVASKRGFYGGYTLARPANQISVGDLFRSLGEPNHIEECTACTNLKTCPFGGDCVFIHLWEEVYDAMNSVYDRTTIQDLIDRDAGNKDRSKPLSKRWDSSVAK